MKDEECPLEYSSSPIQVCSRTKPISHGIGLLFLDEPTSGLDSTRSHNIMSALKRLARRGDRTVICSIHQPRSDIFELFDKILLVSAGRVAYFGTKDGIVPFFSKLGFVCPKYCNPADFASMSIWHK